MLRSYVRQYRMPLIFALLLYLICLAVLLLSALPTHAVLYALGLGAVVGLTMLVLGYFPYARRHKLLRELDIRDSLEHLSVMEIVKAELPGDGFRQRLSVYRGENFGGSPGAVVAGEPDHADARGGKGGGNGGDDISHGRLPPLRSVCLCGQHPSSSTSR